MAQNVQKEVIVSTICVSVAHARHLVELVLQMYPAPRALDMVRVCLKICLEMSCQLARSWIPLVPQFVSVKMVTEALIAPWTPKNSQQDHRPVPACVQP